MAEVAKIGRYHLENLIQQSVPFLYLDLRDDETRRRDHPGHFIFTGSLPVAPDGVLAYVMSLGVPPHHPIVLICENGAKSMAAAHVLEQNSFINAFVLEGGTQALKL